MSLLEEDRTLAGGYYESLQKKGTRHVQPSSKLVLRTAVAQHDLLNEARVT